MPSTLTTPAHQGGEHRVYPDDLLPELQNALSRLADLEAQLEIARDSLEEWSGPEEDKQRCSAELKQAHQHALEPHLWRLARLQEEIRAGGAQPWDDARSFELLVSAVVDYAIFMLSPDGIVSTWNAGAERIKGYAAPEIIGEPFSCFYTDEDRAAGIPEQALRTAADQGKYEAEGWRVRKDGTRFWACAVLDAIRDKQGQLLGFAKITRDITEQQLAQQALEQARGALFQAQKMEALGGLSSGIAHDFNNLLTVVMGNLDLLRRAPEGRRSRLIENAVHAVEQGRKLTQQLLAFGRHQPLQPEVVDVNRLVLRIDHMLKQSLRGDIRIEFDLADDLWPVAVDPAQLQVALINLATNARDAMPNGGRFRIRTENMVRPGEGASEHVVIAVSDTGHGMPPDVLSRIFEPFFTTKEVGKGTGLGLPQVYGIAQQSGGSVDVRSEEGQGTTFTLSLPRAKVQATEADRTADRTDDATEVSLRPLRVLLVEDNSQVAEVAVSLLTERGHSVTSVGNASEALHRLKAGQPFDLVLSDLVMPGGMSGFELAQRIRRGWPALPVLLASGYSEAASKAVKAGFALVHKPYEPEVLLRAIERTVTQIVRGDGDNKVVRMVRSVS